MVKIDKMSINSAKRRFSVDRDGNFTLLADYFYDMKGYSVVFFIFCSKIYVDMTKI